MTLTVRLDATLEAALERYCQEHDIPKSRVVQESLAAYLVKAPATARERGRAGQPAARQAAPGPVFEAFERAGLVGTGALGAAPADKAALRERVTGRIGAAR